MTRIYPFEEPKPAPFYLLGCGSTLLLLGLGWVWRTWISLRIWKCGTTYFVCAADTG